MKEILTARGDYLIYFEDISLVDGTNSYPIPTRAHGDKLREASIVDSDGKTKRELTQISLDELSDYRYDSLNYNNVGSAPFYLQNNNLILVRHTHSPGDKIRMYFYMRPNKLVVETRGFTVVSTSGATEVDTVAPKSGGITGISLAAVVTSNSHGLTTGNKVTITGTDSTPSIDGTYVISVTSSNTYTITGVSSVSVIGTTGSWALAADVLSVTSLNFPKHFNSSLLYDIVTHQSPNKIKVYDVKANSVNINTKAMTFRVADVSTELVVGNYITSAEETIVPNVPTEYHPLIAQMVAVHCMESMADEQQKKSAEQTMEKMKDDLLSIVQNRVEGAPKKIRNRHSTLSQSVNRNRRMR